jgi:hypothetical protein
LHRDRADLPGIIPNCPENWLRELVAAEHLVLSREQAVQNSQLDASLDLAFEEKGIDAFGELLSVGEFHQFHEKSMLICVDTAATITLYCRDWNRPGRSLKFRCPSRAGNSSM